MEEKIEELLDALRKCAKENPNLFDYEQIYKCYLKQAKRVEKDEEYGWPNYIIADYYTENNNKKYAIEVRSCVDHFGYVGTIDGTVSVCIYEYDNSEWVEGSKFFDYGDIITELIGQYDLEKDEFVDILYLKMKEKEKVKVNSLIPKIPHRKKYFKFTNRNY